MSSEELRMNAYYYSFDSVGDSSIDRILSAVACAGKAFHSTEEWTSPCEPYHAEMTGSSCREWIQNAAVAAAAELAAEVTLSAAYQEQLAAEKLAHIATHRTLEASRMLLEAETTAHAATVKHAQAERDSWAVTYRESSDARLKAEAERDEWKAKAMKADESCSWAEKRWTDAEAERDEARAEKRKVAEMVANRCEAKAGHSLMLSDDLAAIVDGVGQ